MLSRRKFALISSLAVMPAAFGCGSGKEETLPGCDGVGAVSSVDDGHTHTVCVPAADLARMPIVPILYTTSLVENHTHQITLTPEQLTTVASGGSVDVTTTEDSGHRHTVTLSG